MVISVNWVSLALSLFQLSSSLSLVALILQLGQPGNSQECSHDTSIDSGDKVLLRGPESFVSVKLRRNCDFERRESRYGETPLLFTGPFDSISHNKWVIEGSSFTPDTLLRTLSSEYDLHPVTSDYFSSHRLISPGSGSRPAHLTIPSTVTAGVARMPRERIACISESFSHEGFGARFGNDVPDSLFHLFRILAHPGP